MSALPDLYSIVGISGVVFRDPLSAKRWLKENGMPDRKVTVCNVIYYGSNLSVDMKTTEQIVLDKNLAG